MIKRPTFVILSSFLIGLFSAPPTYASKSIRKHYKIKQSSIDKTEVEIFNTILKIKKSSILKNKKLYKYYKRKLATLMEKLHQHGVAPKHNISL